MSEDITTPQDDSSEFTDLLSGLAKRKNGTLVANRYRIEKHLGGGGMGDVYLVADTELKDEYRALKLIKGQFVSNETDLKRFQNEVRLTSRLDHPNIVRVFEYGVDDGELFYTMQYVKGKSLRELLEDHDNKLPLDRALEILTELARALEHAHAQKVIHRDLKPENIIIPDDGSPIKLTDFGLARSVEENEERLTKLDSALGGTANYMSPEQAAESTDIDHRSDIYSFGILAFELATGRVPFEGLPGIVKHMHREEPIPSPKKFNRKLPGWFVNIIEACTKKNKEERYQSFAEIARVLEKQSYSFHWRSRKSKIYIMFASLLVGILNATLFVEVPNVSIIGLLAPYVDETTTNAFFRIRGMRKPSKDVIVVSVNEDSFEAMGLATTQAWPRENTAKLLDALSHYSPKGIYLDFLFRKNNLDPDANKYLAEAISRTPTYLAKMRRFGVLSKQDNSEWVLPDPLFSNVSRGFFSVSKPLSKSGNIRNFNNYNPYTDNDELLKELTYHLQISRFEAPRGKDLINYYGPPGTIRSVPYHYFIDGTAKSLEDLEGKYFLVGMDLQIPSSVMQSDTHRTVFSQKMAGVEVHATKLSNILKREWVKKVGWKYALYVNFLLAGLISMIVFTSSSMAALIISAGVMLIWPIAQYLMFINNFYLPSAGLALMLLPVCFFTLWKNSKT